MPNANDDETIQKKVAEISNLRVNKSIFNLVPQLQKNKFHFDDLVMYLLQCLEYLAWQNQCTELRIASDIYLAEGIRNKLNYILTRRNGTTLLSK